MPAPSAVPLASPGTDRAARRRRRVERELKALHLMDGRLRTTEVACALLAVPALGLMWLLAFLKLHWLSASLPAALVLSLALGAGLWWLWRRVLTLAVLILLGLFLVVFESADGLDLFEIPEGRKARRRAKLDRAIARREELLRLLRE